MPHIQSVYTSFPSCNNDPGGKMGSKLYTDVNHIKSLYAYAQHQFNVMGDQDT